MSPGKWLGIIRKNSVDPIIQQFMPQCGIVNGGIGKKKYSYFILIGYLCHSHSWVTLNNGLSPIFMA